MLKRILLLSLLLLSLSAYCQYYNDGQDRAQIKWERIGSLNFDIIYPKGFEQQAKRVLNLMEKSYQFTTVSLDHKPKKISIILHTETVKSNAFLGWAPSRIEMYTTPHQGIYSQDWLEQLAIHEYRHMVQISKIESEMPKLLRVLFGEQAAALITAAYLPFWFIEGDAVAAETGLSSSGRGRLPDFHRELKAQILERETYSYDKAYLGSFKDYVPNYYELGYFMVGGTREIFNKTVWDNVLTHVATRPFSFNAFNRGLKKTIGLNKLQLYDTVFANLKTRWLNDDKQLNVTQFHAITNPSETYTDYRFAFQTSDSTYLTEKLSLNDITRFVEIDQNGKEKIRFTPGYHFNESVSGKGSQLVWIERLSHPRWYHSDLSLLRFYNVKTKQLNEFKFDTKLFAPSLSPDQSKIVAVEGDNNYSFFLDIIDAKSGKIVKQISTNDQDFLITPSWSEDGENLLVVALRNNQKGILSVNVETGSITTILPFANQEIKRPLQYMGNIYFIAGYSGIDNVYRLNPDGTLLQVISSRFGVADHNYYNGQLTYTNYTSKGYQLATVDLATLNLKPFDPEQLKAEYPIADAIAAQEPGSINFNDIDKVEYQPVSFRKAEHLLHIHSWAPVAIDPYRRTADLGLSVMSQNMLSTTEFVGGYRYGWQAQRGEFFANFKYYGWYPVISAEFTAGKNDSYYNEIRQYVNDNNEIVRTDTVKKEYDWQEQDLSVHAYIPLDLSKGKYFKRIQPRLRYSLGNVSNTNNAPKYFTTGAYHNLETGIYMHQLLHKSRQDVGPDFGVVLDASYLTTIAGIADFGSIWAVSNVIYLPGLGKNHGISIYNGYQRKDRMDYSFSDRVRFPRGHRHTVNDQMYSFGADYELPLCYPDLSVWGLTYLKRIKLKLFHDFAFYDGLNYINGEQRPYKGTIKSSGFEISADAHFLRFIAPIELGLRTSYLYEGALNLDFLFNIQYTF